MKVNYIQMNGHLNLPGPGTAAKWSATGQDGNYRGSVKYIVRDECGYWLYLPSGQNKGWYHVPFETVQFACGDPPQEVLDVVARIESDKAEKQAAATLAAAQEEPAEMPEATDAPKRRGRPPKKVEAAQPAA